MRAENGVPIAVFGVEIELAGRDEAVLDAVGMVLSDGGGVSETAPNGQRPVVIGWRGKEGQWLGRTSSLQITSRTPKQLYLEVQLPDYVAISLSCAVT